MFDKGCCGEFEPGSMVCQLPPLVGIKNFQQGIGGKIEYHIFRAKSRFQSAFGGAAADDSNQSSLTSAVADATIRKEGDLHRCHITNCERNNKKLNEALRTMLIQVQ